MFSFLFGHLALFVVPTLALVALVACGFFFGWSLILNRYVLGAVAIALVLVGLKMWREADKEALRAEGAAACVAENNDKIAERTSTISHFVTRNAETEGKLRDQLRTALSALDLARQAAEAHPHVAAKADALCTVTRGFVRGYDAALPGAGGRATVPASAADNDAAAGVPISRIATEIGRDLNLCSKYVEQLNTCEQSRYEACRAWDASFGTNSGCTR